MEMFSKHSQVKYSPFTVPGSICNLFILLLIMKCRLKSLYNSKWFGEDTNPAIFFLNDNLALGHLILVIGYWFSHSKYARSLFLSKCRSSILWLLFYAWVFQLNFDLEDRNKCSHYLVVSILGTRLMKWCSNVKVLFCTKRGSPALPLGTGQWSLRTKSPISDHLLICAWLCHILCVTGNEHHLCILSKYANYVWLNL